MSLLDGETLTGSYPAVPDSVPLARNQLVDFALQLGASEDQVEDIRLSASEALTNVVMHAYRGGPGWIHIRAALASGELWVLIGDDGSGLRPDNESPGLGVGLALIASSSDGMTIMNRAGSGTEVRMRFDLEVDQSPAQCSRPRRSATSPATPRFSMTT